MAAEEIDVNEQLDRLQASSESLQERGLARSAARVAREFRRLAKSEWRLIPYLHANFSLMNEAQNTYEPVFGAEVSIETIALLESEEKARQFQPDFPAAEYAELVYWMSACAYDNLGKHTAERYGYNSDGVHAAVQEGMHVCRRTGKLRCIACFREYAADVFLAAGDLEMSLHHSRTVANTPPDENFDRRWSGAEAVVTPLLLTGQWTAARTAALDALRLVPTYHCIPYARVKTQLLLHTALLMQGAGDQLPGLCSAAECALAPEDDPPSGENPSLELYAALRDALAACCAGEFGRAIDVLRKWDETLTRQQCLASWFEVRTRLVAAYLLAKREREVHALARELESRAKQARNWLTLQRLKGLLDGTVPLSPLALVSASPEDLCAAGQAAAVPLPIVSADTGAASPTPPESEPPPPTPLQSLIERFRARLGEAAEDDEAAGRVLGEMLVVSPETVADADDACWLLYLAGYALRSVAQTAECWRWAERLAVRFPQNATLQNLLANLGAAARDLLGEKADELVSLQRIEALFRGSLDLDHEKPRNFARAGWFFASQGKTDEAERCLARAFHLNRGDPSVALGLAEIYGDSDRARDALAVLDMCIREGGDHPQVLWEAALKAVFLERWDVALTYLDRYEQLVPDEPWTSHYRAYALLHAQRPQEALVVVEHERQRLDGEPRFNLEALLACAHGQLADTDTLRGSLARVTGMRLSEVDYLTLAGLARLLETLYNAVQCLPADVAERNAFEQQLVETGLAPDALFKDHRKRQPTADSVNFYICRIEQPLDERWPKSPGCLTGQSSWPRYEANWGVLATDEDQAEQLVLQWQGRCYHLPPRVLECRQQDAGYRDSPGVVWQGIHEPVESGPATG